MKYNLAVVIGRFQPWHLGHLELLEAARKQSEYVLVLFGVASRLRSTKNPFTPEERSEMIDQEIYWDMVWDAPSSDELWSSRVKSAIGSYENVCLVGYEKDESSYYLRMFPCYNFIPHKPSFQINSTDIRDFMFEERWDEIKPLVSPFTYKWLKSWVSKNNIDFLKLQKKFIKEKSK